MLPSQLAQSIVHITERGSRGSCRVGAGRYFPAPASSAIGLGLPPRFQKRAFPFRIDGVRGMPLTFTNLSIQRNFGAGGTRTWQLRVDAQNVFNRQQWQGPNLNPTNTLFGQVTNVALNQMRFFTFGARMTF
jgi:hypothetical protein